MKNWLAGLVLLGAFSFLGIGAFAQNGVISWDAVSNSFVGGTGTQGQALQSRGVGNPPTWGNFHLRAVLTIATLPTCNVGAVGDRAVVSNGETTITFNAGVSATGAVYAPVVCTNLSASTYGWVYG
jgi:hypothetical protein